ncbi:hypothetical protein KIP31_21105 [Xanthomonas campestris pv. campestris]|uniref:hypothetical protein n=1 Tax=Xanthomonas campestris TaxID=339 RepID=UPI001F2E0D1E|nr:hypothetical protein [Xanthomonas campestris]MCF8811753.1 hypothetical protein [Xanthomonas campestris pv. campestris]
MINRSALSLSKTDDRIVTTIRIFINQRMEEREILEWAINLNPRRSVERFAITLELDFISSSLSQPWRDAWHLLLESWNSGAPPDLNGVDQIDVERRLTAGDRTGDIIGRIVDLVKPVFAASRIRDETKPGQRKKRHTLNTDQLISIGVHAPHPVDPDKIGINGISDIDFLVELADELEFVIGKSQAIALRSKMSSWRIGIPRRVYYVSAKDLPDDEHEPDEFGTGLQAVTKLLFAVVKRLGQLNADYAIRFTERWLAAGDDLRQRLWAVMARDRQYAAAATVFAVLKNCDDDQFWSLQSHPEISEMRAIRFFEMKDEEQKLLLKRIKKGPPSSFWGSKDKARVDKARRYGAAREIRRIELAGGSIPPYVEAWYREIIRDQPDVVNMIAFDEDYWTFKKAKWVGEASVAEYASYSGTERLALLEKDLTTEESGWELDRSRAASSWIDKPSNLAALINDLKIDPEGGRNYSAVWLRLSWAHRLDQLNNESPVTNSEEANTLLNLIDKLDRDTYTTAINGLTAWMDTWGQVLKDSRLFKSVWMKLWPISEATTDASESEQLDPLNTNIQGSDIEEPEDLDTLNTPAGRMVGAFLKCCPKLIEGQNPFELDLMIRSMRDACVSSKGRSELIFRYRIIQEALDYFLRADKDWTKSNIIIPLLEDTKESLILWRALAWRRRFENVLDLLGDSFVTRVADDRMGSQIRKKLAVSVALEILHSLNESRAPAVSEEATTQMLRSATDEIRSAIVRLMSDYITNMANLPNVKIPNKSAERIFSDSVFVFLSRVWPQESTLASPAISRGFARLPAACGECFVKAANSVRRFLVPFESWSLHDYGLRSENQDRVSEVINNFEKASALLDIFDLTISGNDGTPIPHELGTALQIIREIAPNLSRTPSYRRLAAFTRR